MTFLYSITNFTYYNCIFFVVVKFNKIKKYINAKKIHYNTVRAKTQLIGQNLDFITINHR